MNVGHEMASATSEPLLPLGRHCYCYYLLSSRSCTRLTGHKLFKSSRQQCSNHVCHTSLVLQRNTTSIQHHRSETNKPMNDYKQALFAAMLAPHVDSIALELHGFTPK
jgi:hypothetical protein